jgi:transcriptional activator of cad operon
MPLNSSTCPEWLQIGDWRVEVAACRLHARPPEESGPQRLEPRLMDLLCILASEPGRVWTREELLARVWAGSVVGDDALARAVFKLRAALGDDAKSPRYIETIAKRGYRLCAPVQRLADEPRGTEQEASEPVAAQPSQLPDPRPGSRPMLLASLGVLGALALLMLLLSQTPTEHPHALGSSESAIAADAARERSRAGAQAADALQLRADTFYFRFERGDNEAAIELYQRVLGQRPDDVAALAGLANALAQRAIRWPPSGAPAAGFTRLGDALANGHLQRSPARETLQRAFGLADRAVRLQPESAAAYKARGFVQSAQGRFAAARADFERALEIDPQHWAAQINIADSLEIEGRADEALPWFERAFASMQQVYSAQPEQVQPWQPALARLIGERYRQRGDAAQAEAWYRRALALAPTDPEATRELAELLREGGDAAAAQRLCQQLEQRLAHKGVCESPP